MAQGVFYAQIHEASYSWRAYARPNFDESPLVGIISNSQITVRAKPWVSPEEVRRTFENMRAISFRTETPSERRVELVSFVTEFCEGYYNEEHGVSGLALGGPRLPGWRHIMERWNHRHPQEHDWHYKNVRNLRRDFSHAFKALTAHEDF